MRECPRRLSRKGADALAHVSNLSLVWARPQEEASIEVSSGKLSPRLRRVVSGSFRRNSELRDTCARHGECQCGLTPQCLDRRCVENADIAKQDEEWQDRHDGRNEMRLENHHEYDAHAKTRERICRAGGDRVAIAMVVCDTIAAWARTTGRLLASSSGLPTRAHRVAGSRCSNPPSLAGGSWPGRGSDRSSSSARSPAPRGSQRASPDSRAENPGKRYTGADSDVEPW